MSLKDVIGSFKLADIPEPRNDEEVAEGVAAIHAAASDVRAGTAAIVGLTELFGVLVTVVGEGYAAKLLAEAAEENRRAAAEAREAAEEE